MIAQNRIKKVQEWLFGAMIDCNHLNIKPKEFIMVGNSLKSDILPVLNIGCKAIHAPYHTTWEHEKISESKLDKQNFTTVNSISEILKFFTNETAHG